LIVLADKYTKLSKIKDTSADISDLMKQETRKAMSQFKPKVGRLSQTNKSSLMSDVKRDLQASSGAETFFSFPFAYDPATSSVDRMWLPTDRREQNRYWRTFYATDPLCGNVMDMYSELPISDFELSGDGIEGDVKKLYEDMCQECDIMQTLIFMIKEFLILGEVTPHCFFKKSKGIWTHITIHDPDHVEVFDSPLVDHDPVVELIPDDQMRKIFTSSDPRMMELRQRIPKEIMTRLISRMNIPLSNLNCTFIPRKAHPYYVRGMSILSRLFKIFIYEDAIYDASIATARRHAGPLKIVKLGDPASGWLPEPGEEDRVAELLAQSELDPNAFLIYHYGINFEAFGTTDKIMNIGKEWDWIERAKLSGMGISKAFVTGEVTYASAEKGLEVFLSRLLTLRQLFENLWLKPKFFKPIAQINQLYMPTPAEVSHRIKIRKGKSERRLIVPDIEWQKTLRPAVDQDKMDAFMKLKEKGFPVSFSTTMSTAGLDFKEQAKMTKEENEFLQKEGLAPAGEEETGGMPGGMPGGGTPQGDGMAKTPSVTPAPDGLPGFPASKEEIKEEKKDYYLAGVGNRKQLEKNMKDNYMEENDLEGFGVFAEFKTPLINDPHNYKSREDWQKALYYSKIPQDAKNYIKNLENSISDGWEHSFDGMWNQLESRIGRFGVDNISSNDVNNSVVDSILEHMKKMDSSLIDNSLNGIFHNGKLYSYDALNFEEYKKKKSFKISAVTIDTMEDDLVLRHMKERLENHLAVVTNDDIRMAITEKVKEALGDAISKSASAAELKKAIKSIYHNAVWKLQQAVRTEATNNFTFATLLGFKEQGIKRAKWNAHNDNTTCSKCRGLNGLEFDVDYLLSLGNHPLIKMAHHQCRCWLTAVINHIDWDRIEKQYAQTRTKFQTPTKIDYPVETKKTFITQNNQFKNVPVEYEKPIKAVQNRVQKASFIDEWPKEIEFVVDVADSPEFIKVYGKRDDLNNRIQYWKDASGKVWISNFYIKDKDPQIAITKIWAENIWPKVSEYWKEVYEEKMKPKRIPDLSQETVERISNVLKPIPIILPFRVGMMRGISLNKKFREQNDEMVREALRDVQINDNDVEKIITWRGINPSWTTTGNSVEVGQRDLQQEGFVSELAKRSAKDLFVESLGTYVGDGFLLNFRDPWSYEHLKNTIFKGKEFM